ncbi:Uncharacterised protein [uncultured archaeon]|nr:Uncharacterised protein [uncultured archaeon]
MESQNKFSKIKTMMDILDENNHSFNSLHEKVFLCRRYDRKYKVIGTIIEITRFHEKESLDFQEYYIAMEPLNNCNKRCVEKLIRHLYDEYVRG